MEFLGNGYSFYHTNCGKNIIILESKIEVYSIQIQELKKEICSLNLLFKFKTKKVSSEKSQRSFSYRFFLTGFENYVAQIAVLKWLEAKTSMMYFGKAKTNAMMGHWNTKMKISINL